MSVIAPSSVTSGPGFGPSVSPPVFNAESLSSMKADIIRDSLNNPEYLRAVFSDRSPVDCILFPSDPQSQQSVVEIKNAIIVELLNQYGSKEAVLDEFPVMRDYIERSASENFKALVDSYSTSPVASSELVQIQQNEYVAIMSLLDPSFSKHIAQGSFTPNFEQISEALLFQPDSEFWAIYEQQQFILASIQGAPPRSMAPSYRVFTTAARRALEAIDGLGTSSSKFDGAHSVTSIKFAKQQYLDGIRTSAMLGFQECIIFSQFFRRPIVVVKNNIVDSVYGEEFFDTGVKPIFVVNYNNYHFEGWQPNELKVVYRPGDECSGRKLPGNRGYNYGMNDCLIGAIRADGDANQALNSAWSNNQMIRAYLADNHAQFSPSAAGYIADRSQFWKEQVFRVDDIDQNPAGVREYAGIHLIVTPDGKAIEDCDDSEVQRLSGDICNGRRHGTWFECDHTGRYEQVYVHGVKHERKQTHRREELEARLIPV